MKYLKDKISKAESTIAFQNINMPACIGIIDIVNSTSIASKLCNLDTAKYYTIFLNSISRIIHEHDGVIVKNIGDSLLYFFEMNIEDKKNNLLPLECGITMLECQEIINQILQDEKLPKIQYRISSEYGKVMVATTNTINTLDIFGTTVNYCSKINKMANPNEFIIGHDLKTIVKDTSDYSIKGKSFYHTDLKNNFPIYSVGRNIHD